MYLESSLPKNSAGKIVKAPLRERAGASCSPRLKARGVMTAYLPRLTTALGPVHTRAACLLAFAAGTAVITVPGARDSARGHGAAGAGAFAFSRAAEAGSAI